MKNRDLVEIRRQIIEAHEAVIAERAKDVRTARDNARLLLGSHGLFTASFAVSRDPGCQSYYEFLRMADRMRWGGYHNTRKAFGMEPIE